MTTTTLRPSRPAGFTAAPASPSTRPRRSAGQVPRVRYIVVILTGIFSILGLQLLLSIAVSDGAYEIASLKGDMRRSAEQRQMVQEDISALNAPDTLANLATAMGMVADNNPAYLRLSDKRVIGEPIPAGSDGSQAVYGVTAGDEPVMRPAIVEDVMRTVVSAAETADAEGTVVEGEAADLIEADAERSPAPVVEPVQTSAPTTVTVATKPPVKKFGGTIPAPVTR